MCLGNGENSLEVIDGVEYKRGECLEMQLEGKFDSHCGDVSVCTKL